MNHLKRTLFLLCHFSLPFFFGEFLNLSTTCVTGLCIGGQAQTSRRGTLTKIHWIAANCSCSGPVAVLYLPHAWIPQMYIVYRQKWSDIYLSLYGTCTYLHLIIVFLQQCCMSGTSEVHCGGLSLKRSARGAGWVVCVCANVWSLLESIGHVLIYVDEGAMDWFRAWVTSSQETRELHRDLEERSKTQALSLFEHARAPSRSADDYRWLVRFIVAEVFDLKLWIVGQSLRRKSCRAARGTYWVSYCSSLGSPPGLICRNTLYLMLKTMVSYYIFPLNKSFEVFIISHKKDTCVLSSSWYPSSVMPRPGRPS